MIALISLNIFLGFYVLYNTSKKATLESNLQLEKWIQQNPKPSRFIGLAILALAYSFLISIKAIGVSTLIYFIQIMVIGSLIVILAPLKLINYKIVLGTFLIAFLFETLC
ncbi:hypothetical protein [Flavobacterium flavipallidum]|uniref:DUF3325 domain-containing protein n=1 Tax=Flavobacterium flavipallidum TaxID=3139140 RepID=A0ABU9HNF6_9FLAO